MTEQTNNDLRPLIPGRRFGISSWLANRWPRFSRDYNAVSIRGSGTESESPIRHTTTVFSPSLPDSNVPPAPPNTPPETVSEEPSVAITIDPETTDREQLLDETHPQAESSSMAAGGGQSSSGASPSALPEARLEIFNALRLGWDLAMNGNNLDASGRTTSSERICLICLEPLSEEEFANGSAISLECQCKGDAALRHASCAQKWVDTKGDLTCDVCRAPIRNLNAPPPRSEAGSNRHSDTQTDESRNRYPTPSDVFDCIRMTWVVTIVCVLFFDLDIASALVSGLLVAVIYTWVCQLVRCLQYQSTTILVTSDQDLDTLEAQPPLQRRAFATPEVVVQ